MPPGKPALLTEMSPDRLAFNIKMMLMLEGGGTISVAPDGKNELNSLIDVISKCVVEEIQQYGCVTIPLPPDNMVGIPVTIQSTPVATIPTILKLK